MKLTFQLLFVLLSTFSFAQKRLAPPGVTKGNVEENSKCIYTGKYNKDKIAKSFPFNKASHITIVSFEDYQFSNEPSAIEFHQHEIGGE